MLISPRGLKSLNSIEKIQPWMLVATFNGNPSTTIISCDSPTNTTKVTDEPITKILYNQLDIKIGQCMQEELDLVRRKIKNRKAAGLDKTHTDVRKTRKFDDILPRYCNAVYNQKHNRQIDKGLQSPFPEEG